MKFCADVDNAKEMHAPRLEELKHSPQKNQTKNSQIQWVPWPIETLLERIRSYVIMKRVRVKEYFIDFDKLRKGNVTEQKMKTVINQLGFTFTKDEIDKLYDHYKDENKMFK